MINTEKIKECFSSDMGLDHMISIDDGIEDVWFFYYSGSKNDFKTEESFFAALIVKQLMEERKFDAVEDKDILENVDKLIEELHKVKEVKEEEFLENVDEYVDRLRNLKKVTCDDIANTINDWMKFTLINVLSKIKKQPEDLKGECFSDCNEEGTDCSFFISTEEEYIYLDLMT